MAFRHGTAALISGIGCKAGMVSPLNGVITGLFLWFGFVATTIAVNNAFQGARRALTLIDGAHWLGVLAIQGLVIGLIGV